MCWFCFTARLAHITKDVYYSSSGNGDDDNNNDDDDDDNDNNNDDDDDDNNNNNNNNSENKFQDCQNTPSITSGYRLAIHEELMQIREKIFEE